jgi:cation diffusion facilitator family transporter
VAESKLAVYGAIVANVAIATTKFIAAGVTGSSAMLSEGIHSVVDTLDGVLLLVGMHLSQREATPEHPFGHGKELYFWSLIVAVLIFGVGGGVSLGDPRWNYIVLAAAAVFEGASFTIALRAFRQTNRGKRLWAAIRTSKDPTTYTVLAEDAAALAGLVAAAIGVYVSQRFDLPRVDGAASVVIGVLLATVAVLLIREARGLLIGEGIAPETARAVQDIACSHACVCNAGLPLSMYVGPEEVLLTLDVRFQPNATTGDIVDAVKEIEHEIHERFPKITRIYIEASALGAAQH